MDEAALKKLGERAMLDWLNRHSAQTFEEVVRKEMFSILERYKDEVLMKAMGFDNRFGNWEVSRSNGRVSVVSTAIEKSLAPIAAKWMEESLAKGIELTPTMKKTIREDVKRQLKDQVYQTHYSIVRDKVTAAVDEAVEEAKQELLGEFSATVMFEHGEEL